MSVLNSVSSVSYILSTAAQILAVPFYFLDNAHVVVTNLDTDATLVLGTDYTLTGVGVESGGSLTTIPTVGNEIVIGTAILIQRIVPATQLVSYVENGRFPSKVHERALDKLTMIAQQLDYSLKRTVRVESLNEVPPLSVIERANGVIGFDSGGGLQIYTPSTPVLLNPVVIHVSTVALLRAVSTALFVSGQMIEVSGYYVAGDGGGGPVRYLSTGEAPGTYVDNGGSVIIPTGGDGSAAWLWNWSGEINVRWFGAKGDGATNDSDAFQAATTFATTAKSRKVYASHGTYVLGVPTSGSQFCVYLGNLSNIEFFGDGEASVLKLAGSVPRNQCMFGSGIGSTMNGVFWHDMVIDLNGSNNLQTSYADPLRLNSFVYSFSNSQEDIRFERIKVLDASGSQVIRISDDTSALGDRITIRDCEFRNFGIGVTGNFQQDVSVLYIFANNITIENCTFKNDPFTFDISRGHTAVEIHAGISPVVKGCSFTQTQLPILIASDAGDTVRGGVYDCYYTDCGYAISFDPSGSDDVDGFRFSRNHYYSSKPIGISIIYIGSSSESARSRKGVVIENNSFVISTSTQGRGGVACISSYWNDVIIKNNDFRNLTAPAVYVDGVYHNSTGEMVLYGNTFDSCGSDIAGSPIFPTDGTPVQVCFIPGTTASIKALTVENNIFKNTAGKSYSVLGHVYLGANVRAGIVSVRGNIQPDASGTLVYDAGSVASTRKDIYLGNCGNMDKRTGYYGGIIIPAATISLPNWGSLFYVNVSGAQNITSIDPTYDGHEITLYFNSGSASSVVDGSNLKLNGDFAWSSDSVIKLVCIGANWFELSRCSP
jgi:hypothetical protein